MTFCKYCEKEGRFGKSIMICPDCVVLHTKQKTKICSSCKTLKSWEDFKSSKICLFGIHSVCNPCAAEYANNRLEGRKAFLDMMLMNCKGDTNRRNRGGRNLEMSWTLDEVENKLAELGDKCAISGLPMSFRTHSDWKCSPERLDNDKGYNKTNATLVCLEFQMSGKDFHWTHELVDLICTVESNDHPRLSEIAVGEFAEDVWTPHCKIATQKCKECRQSYHIHYAKTVKGKLSRLVCSSKYTTKRRNAKGRSMAHNIDVEHLLVLLQQQKGKCYWSGHHLLFDGGMTSISLERINVGLGYIKGNVCLVMKCMNSIDHSSQSSVSVKNGAGGWTREKVEYLRAFRQNL